MNTDIIGHWYLKDLGGPFHNFLNNSPEQRKEVGGILKEKYGRGYFHEKYLSGREEVEMRLHQLFLARGGRPEIKHPIYCFLGSHPTELIYEHREDYEFKFFKISDIPCELITFTYPGSITSMQIADRKEAAEFRSPYHGKLFLKEEINNVIDQYGMPGVDFVPTGRRQYDVLVEAQIWSTSIFERVKEVADVTASWLPWITHPAEDRRGLKKD